MCNKWSHAASLVVMTALAVSVAPSRTLRANNSTGDQKVDPPAGARIGAGDLSSGETALAVGAANFAVRTGLGVAPDAQGRIVVRHVRDHGNAAQIGVREGDILTAIDSVPINAMNSLSGYLTQHQNQSAFDLTLDRSGRTFTAALGRQLSLMGVFADPSDRPVIHRVQAGSPAASAGVRPGDLIQGVDRQPIDTMTDLMNFGVPLVRDLDPGTQMTWHVNRDGGVLAVSIPRPSDEKLGALTPAEQAVINRQTGVLSTASRMPVYPTQAYQRVPRHRDYNGDTQFYWWYAGDPFYFANYNGYAYYTNAPSNYDPYLGTNWR
jgi:predicted metalloprotease with PDZ domain